MHAEINLLNFLELRTIVLSLGEVTHFGWWKSQFLSSTGLSFLERMYPNSRFAEAIRSATQGALEIHDANIGIGNVFHLFRLSQSMEIELDRALSEQGRLLDEKYEGIWDDKQKLLAMLTEMSEEKQADVAFGPLDISYSEEQIIPTMASLYLQAFQQEKQIFPYFNGNSQ